MKRLDKLQRGCAWTILALVAAVGWPSAAWSQAPAAQQECLAKVPGLLANWGTQLRDSSSENPGLVVKTYTDTATLLPTCANGPKTGHNEITDYFHDFLKLHPVATFDDHTMRIGGNCQNLFASGLYSFALGDERKNVRARYTYVFEETAPGSRSWLITQHHSSLEPKPSDGHPAPECPSH